VGEREYVGTIPVPDSVTVCVAAPPPEFTLRVADFAPVDVGWNTTLIVQAFPTATEVPQVFVCENWVGLPPVSVMLVIGTAIDPVFVTVIGCSALAIPTPSFPKGTVPGVTVYVGTIPVPVRLTFCFATPPPLFTFRVAVLAPVDVGLNTTLIVQVAPTASDVPQVLVSENCPAFVPVSVMLVICRAALAVFVTVTDCEALATPSASLPNATVVGVTKYVKAWPAIATPSGLFPVA
jgi:hypothetical protein